MTRQRRGRPPGRPCAPCAPCAQLVDHLDQRLDLLGVHRRQQAMAQVEDVSGSTGGRIEYRLGPLTQHVQVGVETDRVEVALDRHVMADQVPAVGQIYPPVQALDLPAGLTLQRIQLGVARQEVDHRQPLGQALDQPLRMRQDMASIVLGRKAPGPAVEDLYHLATGLGLRREVPRECRHQAVHQCLPGTGVVVHDRLGVLVVPRSPSLDRVTRQGKRSPGEPDQRTVTRQIGPHTPDRLQHKVHLRHVLELAEPIDVAGCPQRVADRRAFAGGVLKLQAHRAEDRQQVGEQDRRVDTQCRLGTESHLRGEIGSSAQFEKRDLAADLHVLGQISTRLPHQPDRSRIDRLAADRLHEARFVEWGGHRGGLAGGVRRGRTGALRNPILARPLPACGPPPEPLDRS